MYKCICGKEYEKIRSLRSHEQGCKLVLGDRYDEWLAAKKEQGKRTAKIMQMSKAEKDNYYNIQHKQKVDELNKWISEKHQCKICGKEMTQKYGSGLFCSSICHSKNATRNIKNFVGKALTEEKEQERRNKLSKIAKQNKLGGYHPGSGRGKQGWYKGYWCDSSYELAFVIYNVEHNIPFIRNKDKFEYTYENKKHKYIPDFKLNDLYIEIKGFERPNDKFKYAACPNLKVMYEKDLKYCFDYVINKYGKNYIKLYENKESMSAATDTLP